VSLTYLPSRQRLRSASSNQLAVSPFNLSSLHCQQTDSSGFRRQLLEQLSITRDICTVAGDIQTACEDISLSFVISGLIYTAFNCGPCDNFCYLGHTKNLDDDDDDDKAGTVNLWSVNWSVCPYWLVLVPQIVHHAIPFCYCHYHHHYYYHHRLYQNPWLESCSHHSESTVWVCASFSPGMSQWVVAVAWQGDGCHW